jgi:co-chaperonin GroES (HSP10)
MIDAKQLKELKQVNAHWVIVRRCLEGEKMADGSVKKGSLYLPEHYADGGMDGVKFTEISQVTASYHLWIELVDVGERCEIFKREHSRCWRNGKPGLIAMCPELPKQFEVAEEGYSFVDERSITPILFHPDGRIEPMRDIVLMDLHRTKTSGDIDLDDSYERATPSGTVIAMGEKVNIGIQPGDKVLLAQTKKEFYIPILRQGDKWLSIVRQDRVIGVEE